MDGCFLAADAFSVLIYGVEQSAEKRTGRCWGKMWPPVGVSSVLPRPLRAVQLGTLRSSPKCWLAWQPAAPSASQTCLPSSLPKEPQASTGSAGRGRGVWGVLTAQVLLSAWCPVSSAPFFLEGKSWWDWKCQRVKAGSVCEPGSGQPPGTGRLCG